MNGTRSSDTFDTQIDDTQIASTVNGITGGVKDAAFFISGVIGDKFAKDLDDAIDIFEAHYDIFDHELYHIYVRLV